MSKSLPNDVFQYSLHSALTAGLKDGGPPVSFLTSQGSTLGVGTFSLDEDDDDDDDDDDDNDRRGNANKIQKAKETEKASDLVLLDGKFFSIDADGTARRAQSDDQLAFVMATAFQPAQRIKAASGTTAKALKEMFERRAGAKNRIVPFRVRGAFKYINTVQETYWEVQGTVAGFCVPKWQAGVSGEGMNGVFLSDDATQGGRVLDFETADGVLVEWARVGRLHLAFPADEEFDELRL